MTNTPVCIVGHGARTPLGLHSASSAAAYRAGISGVSTHPFLVDQAGEPMPAAMDGLLPVELIGAERCIALAETALSEACEPLCAEGRRSHRGIPLYLGLPEVRPGFTHSDAQEVGRRLSGWSSVSSASGRLPVALSTVEGVSQGHAAGLAALMSAAERIRDGSLEMCLAGGVDSYFHPDTMEWLDTNRRLMGTVSRSGFVPGEAAGFCLLTSAARCEQLGLRPLAWVGRGHLSREPEATKAAWTGVGEGMTNAVRAALEGRCEIERRIDAVYLDQNGERYRGDEWGFVCLRLGRHFRDSTAYESPSDCWGDVGAASGPLFAVLTCQAAWRGYAAGPSSLLCASSQGGLRGALPVSTGSRTPC